jgi:hypothetical protein
MYKRQQPTSNRVEYVVRYRRRWWRKAQFRPFQSEPHTGRFAAKLQSGGRPDLAPLVELRIEQRTVGSWQPVEDGPLCVYTPRAAGW